MKKPIPNIVKIRRIENQIEQMKENLKSMKDSSRGKGKGPLNAAIKRRKEVIKFLKSNLDLTISWRELEKKFNFNYEVS